MANGNNPTQGTRGKGGNFDSRKNPFGNIRLLKSAPDLASVAMLGGTLDKVLRAGHAVMLGHTRDGGALVLTILEGENRHRTYCSNNDELDAAITAMENMFVQD